ncbi:DNA-methyltransferase [Halocalculus aciditolerans]|uniref:Type II methyltransferase n=1 Tax=Halocalculus aciditolerans TaxID=1383812 RepID=A0A830FGA3_9EURY|nr:site-specific DNA-methyltransferase [Halocalculus aciditolerans]GGL52609.1 DNA modification methylase [Halocalculus aciditolerans]
MRTRHTVTVGDARSLPLPDDSVELVVTSPPYPMVEMWDEAFGALDDRVAPALDRGDGDAAFDAMHDVLDDAWDEVARVLVDGGIACVNVGDATRTLDSFELYPNHERVVRAFRERGFDQLPGVLWRKPTNSAAKFMGSGTLPPNAYVTLEHEHVLVFRNGRRRSFPPGDDDRYGAAYFWEERNEWFSDLWTDIRGKRQALDGDARERSAAFPLELPFRLINMYSAYGDTVLDPFWGTGTTTTAAMVAGRHSVGVERLPDLVDAFREHTDEVPGLSTAIQSERLDDHRAFVDARREDGDTPGYDATYYDFPVVTKTERDIRLYAVDDVEPTPDGYVADHTRLEQ